MSLRAVVDSPSHTDGVWSSLSAFGVRTPGEVLAEEADRDVFLIDGILHSGLTLLYGESEVGKSHLVVSLIHPLTQGGDWMGHAVNGPAGRVLVLASDPGDVWEYARRLGSVRTEAVGVARPPGPDETPGWVELADRCLGLGVRLVVLDNLFSWASGKDVNLNAEVGQALACLDHLIDRGVAVLLVHHTPKGNGKTPSGSHSIQARARHSIRLSAQSMTVHGNAVAEAVYAVERQDGRIVALGRGTASVPQARGPKGRPKRRIDRGDQERQALSALSLAGEPSMSQRGMADFLVGRVDGVQTQSQGRTLVQLMLERASLVKGLNGRLSAAGSQRSTTGGGG